MDDRIRNLCKELARTSDPEQQLSIVAKLREELHLHIERLRVRLGEYPIEQRRRVHTDTVSSEIPATTARIDSIRVVVLKDDRFRGTTESANEKPKKK